MAFGTLGNPPKDGGFRYFEVYFIAWLKELNYDNYTRNDFSLSLNTIGKTKYNDVPLALGDQYIIKENERKTRFVLWELSALQGILDWIESTLENNGGKNQWVLTRKDLINDQCRTLVDKYKIKMGGEMNLRKENEVRRVLCQWEQEEEAGSPVSKTNYIDLLTLMYVDLLKTKEFLDAEYGKIPRLPKSSPALELKKNPYTHIFRGDLAYTIFDELYGHYKNRTTHLADFSSVFYDMKADGYIICRNKDFIIFLSEHKDIHIDKIDSRQSGRDSKTTLYNNIKDKYIQKHEKSTKREH